MATSPTDHNLASTGRRPATHPIPPLPGFQPFEDRLRSVQCLPLSATGIHVLQISLGRACNQACKHCHVDAGPHRTESMTRRTMQDCLDVLARVDAKTVDITGGAPEMHPDFQWFVDQIKARDRHVIVRSNLTILMQPGSRHLPEFLADRRVEITASLPYYLQGQTDAQRGGNVFETSITALKRLNDLGYGKPETGLTLNLVYNPVGAFLPPRQHEIEATYHRELRRRHGIEFNSLYTITNMPINRYLDYLIRTDNYAPYMQKLAAAFNPLAAQAVMCRTTLNVGWDGRLYDCDFNQALGMPVNHQLPDHVRDFDPDRLAHRQIRTGDHCYGCTAGAGSSCTGSMLG